MDRLWVGYGFGSAACAAVLLLANLVGTPLWAALLGYVALTPIGIWIAKNSIR
jgi:hypothetical protein